MRKLFPILLLFSALSLRADPGAKMTPERQQRIEHAIEVQHKVLPESKEPAQPVKLPEGTIHDPVQASSPAAAEKSKQKTKPTPKWSRKDK